MTRRLAPGPTGPLLTVTEVCQELGIARSTFYDWKTKGSGPRCYKLPNGDLRIRRVDLDEWFASLQVEAA
jgi:excisionase family DNA binding protein